jgi:hypothetical protein
MKEPLACTEARRLLTRLYLVSLGFSGHARREMEKDDVTEPDVTNVVRCGRIHEEAEFENGSWRYRVHTSRFCVVVAFRGLDEEDESARGVVVVTVWRKR